MINLRIISGLVLLLALTSGCSSFSHKKKEAAASASQQDPAAQPKPVLVGTITFVNPEQRFVLIEVSPRSMPESGQALKCLSNGEESGIVAVTEEREPPFISADIVKGEPHKGDEVYQ